MSQPPDEFAASGSFGGSGADKPGDRQPEFGQGRVDTLRPLTNEFISEVLDSHDYYYFTDKDGDVGGRWAEVPIYFFRMGRDNEILNIRGRSRRQFTVDEVPALHAFCNSWNNDKLWPKAYVHVHDDGTAYVYGECSTDLEHGATFDQLEQLISCAISTNCSLADAVDDLP